MTRICFLIPYFGRWPFWMPFFVESCRHNHDIDWILYSDCGDIPNCPPNVKVKPMSFQDYCALVERKLEIRFSPESPYKLCDLKPAYGLIHQDDIHSYDFWAFGDIDLVYGRLRDYFSETRLSQHKLFSTHERRISGHLCLIKNDPLWNSLFRRVANWKSTFSSPTHCAFDESAFTRLFIKRKNWPSFARRFLDTFNPWRKSAEFIESFSTPNGVIPWTTGKKIFPQRWWWNNGIISNDIDGERTFPYLHFIGLKGLWKNATEEAKYTSLELGSYWEISKDGIFTKASK